MIAPPGPSMGCTGTKTTQNDGTSHGGRAVEHTSTGLKGHNTIDREAIEQTQQSHEDDTCARFGADVGDHYSAGDVRDGDYVAGD